MSETEFVAEAMTMTSVFSQLVNCYYHQLLVLLLGVSVNVYQPHQWFGQSNRSSVCVFVCLSVSFDLYLPRWFTSTLSMSSLKVKIIGQRSWSEEELMLLKWSLRSEVRAFQVMMYFSFSALMLLVGLQEGYPACGNLIQYPKRFLLGICLNLE